MIPNHWDLDVKPVNRPASADKTTHANTPMTDKSANEAVACVPKGKDIGIFFELTA